MNELIKILLLLIFIVIVLRFIEANTAEQHQGAIFIGLKCDSNVHSTESTMNVKVGGYFINNSYKGF